MPESLSSRVARFESDIEIAHQIVHGSAEESVETENGPVRSFAKVLADYDAQLVQTVTGQNRAAAEAAAVAAIAARDEAQRAGGIYADTAAGLAATADGEYFSVLSAESDEYLILYLNSAGAAIEQKRYPSSARIAALELQVAELLYVPPTIGALLIDGASSKTVEVGSSVDSVILSWTPSGDEPESQSIDQGIGSVPAGTTSKVVDGPFTASRTWTLTVGDTSPAGNPVEDSAQASLLFRLKRYWGVSANPSLSTADILALSGEFATVRGKSVVYDATGGRYLYYCYPASWGALAGMTVGGLAFSDYTETVQSFTTSSGHTEDYRVARFNNLQNGANIQVVWA